MTKKDYQVDDKTYTIMRYYFVGRQKIMQTGLSLKQAQKHCQDPSTQEKGVYFDGYTEEL